MQPKGKTGLGTQIKSEDSLHDRISRGSEKLHAILKKKLPTKNIQAKGYVKTENYGIC